MICIVCKNSNTEVFAHFDDKKYWKCRTCKAIYLDKRNYLNSKEEYAHYLTHNNDIEDERYKLFLSKLMNPLIKELKENSTGLDYGCGPGPALAKMLEEIGHKIYVYDPFFFPIHENLSKKYDFICCTETIEHFHDPYKEFHNFNELIINKGVIGLMTNFYTDDNLFEDWYYRKDPTHVVFYCEETFYSLAKIFKWNCEINEKNIVIFKKI